MGLFGRKIAILNLDGRTKVEVRNKKEAEFYAKQLLKCCYESTELVNKTKKPRVFFERYNFLIKETENLAQLEKFLKFKGRTPSVTLLYLKKSKEKETNTMIERAWDDLSIKLTKLKTNKGKENNINKLYQEFDQYKNEMTESNIDLYNSYYNTFINNI